MSPSSRTMVAGLVALLQHGGRPLPDRVLGTSAMHATCINMCTSTSKADASNTPPPTTWDAARQTTPAAGRLSPFSMQPAPSRIVLKHATACTIARQPTSNAHLSCPTSPSHPNTQLNIPCSQPHSSLLPFAANASSHPQLPQQLALQLRSNHTERRPQRPVRSRHGWARDSEERDRVIGLLGDLAQLEAYWNQWGGSSNEFKVSTGASSSQGTGGSEQDDSSLFSARPCRLTHLNLAKFLSRAAWIAPPGVLHPHPQPGSQAADDGFELDVERLRWLCDQACSKMRTRGKMCAPAPAGLTLWALARLGHQDMELTRMLVHVATRRMEEAYTRDLRVIGQSLQSLNYREGGEWWTAAWAHLQRMLPTGLVHRAHVDRLAEAGIALGHPAPATVQRWVQKQQTLKAVRSKAHQLRLAATRQ